jgi:transmembrane sensor
MSARLQETSVAEQAARWVMEFDDADEPAALDRFAVWLKASPQNVEAYLSAAAAWGAFDHMDPERTIDVQRMVRDAQANVVTLGTADESATLQISPGSPPAARGSGWLKYAAAAAVAVITGTLLLVFMPARTQTYATEIGEQRTVKLADGSVVYLNTHSTLRVEYSPNAREIHLLRGEALFVVEKDPLRPFRVDAGQTRVQAIGTQFNVYRRPGEIEVSVIEGAVRIADKQDLVAGEKVRIAAGGAIDKPAAANIADEVAWRERRLVFRDDPLTDIVAEFNRYNADYPLRFEGDARTAPSLTGVFRADDPEALLLFLQGNSQLSIERTARGASIR